jgi:hypothetical protein
MAAVTVAAKTPVANVHSSSDDSLLLGEIRNVKNIIKRIKLNGVRKANARKVPEAFNNFGLVQQCKENKTRILTYIKPEPNGIYFLDIAESSQPFKFSPMTSCALESACKHNPDLLVYLLLNRGFSCDDEIMSLLLNLPNLRIGQMPIDYLTGGSRVSGLLSRRQNNTSSSGYLWERHYSDVFRLLIMSKLGGIYYDTDSMTLKSFKPLMKMGKNVIGCQTGSPDHCTRVNNGFLLFKKNNSFINGLLQLYGSFDLNNDSVPFLGISVFNDFVKAVCMDFLQNYDLKYVPTTCWDYMNITLLSHESLYLYGPSQSSFYFLATKKTEVLAKVDHEKPYALHYYNSHSEWSYRNGIDTNSAVATLARLHCPKICSNHAFFFGQLR